MKLIGLSVALLIAMLAFLGSHRSEPHPLLLDAQASGCARQAPPLVNPCSRVDCSRAAIDPRRIV